MGKKRKPAWPADAPAQLLVLSGAGLSAESGLATFRDQGGLWDGHDPMAVANAASWKRNFDLVHAFYNTRRQELATVTPNAAHRALAAWQDRFRLTNLTQNCDDLLERAGCREVHHLHGRLRDMRCAACGHLWDVGYTAFAGGEDRCPRCNSRKGVRPGLVMFGDEAPLYRLMYRALDALRARDTFVVIGTSGEVLPVFEMARRTRALSLLCNLETPADPRDREGFDLILTGPATKTLLAAQELLEAHLGDRPVVD